MIKRLKRLRLFLLIATSLISIVGVAIALRSYWWQDFWRLDGQNYPNANVVNSWYLDATTSDGGLRLSFESIHDSSGIIAKLVSDDPSQRPLQIRYALAYPRGYTVAFINSPTARQINICGFALGTSSYTDGQAPNWTVYWDCAVVIPIWLIPAVAAVYPLLRIYRRIKSCG